MKKIATKLITISSQLLMVALFMVFFFAGTKTNDKSLTVDNYNFSKMADSVSFLFKNEEKMLSVENDDVVVDLSESTTDKKEEEVNTEEQTQEEVVQEEATPDPVPVPEPTPTPVPLEPSVLETFVGNLTGYGPDCYGCTSGKTSSGHNLRESIYYEDAEYGTVRILAADSYFPFYSIIKVSNVPGMDPFLAVVLDTGGNVGFNKMTLFDLAYATEKDPNIIGLTSNVKFEVLRRGR